MTLTKGMAHRARVEQTAIGVAEDKVGFLERAAVVLRHSESGAPARGVIRRMAIRKEIYCHWRKECSKFWLQFSKSYLLLAPVSSRRSEIRL